MLKVCPKCGWKVNMLDECVDCGWVEFSWSSLVESANNLIRLKTGKEDNK